MEELSSVDWTRSQAPTGADRIFAILPGDQASEFRALQDEFEAR